MDRRFSGHRDSETHSVRSLRSWRRLGSVDGPADEMRSGPVEGRGGSGEVGADEAAQGVAPDGRRDGVGPGADREQVAVVDLRRARDRCEGVRGTAAERGIAREHGAAGVEDRRRVEVDGQRREPGERRRRRQRRGAHRPGRSAGVGRARLNGRVTFTRIAWLVTVIACIVTGVALLLSGYQGYAAVFGAVGACAAINLR